MINFSKKMLALIMAMLMMFSCMAISASAEGEGTTPPSSSEGGENTETEAPSEPEEPTPVTVQIAAPKAEFDLATMSIEIEKPENIARGEEDAKIFYPVAITAALGETAVEVVKNDDGSYTIADVELDKEYTITASIVDENEEDGEILSGEASTKVTPVITIPGTKDICTFDKENKKITVKKIDGIVIGGTSYFVGVELQPSASSETLGDGSTMFYNLEYGKKYTVKAYLVLAAGSDKIYSTENFEVTVDKLQTKPVTPVPTAITSKSITISAEKGVEYTISGDEKVYTVADKQTTIKFDGLTKDTSYTITAQKPASEGYYASEKVSITVKTKKAATDVVPKLTLDDKSNTYIKVTADVKNVEFKLDNGAWQSSGEFKNLKANTQYNIYARVKAAADQEESPVSEALIVKTNAVANYEASDKKIAFKCEDGQYANTKISFTVSGDGPANINNAVFGDTRIVPVLYIVTYGEETLASGTFKAGKVSETGSFTPAEAYAEKSVTVTIMFETQKFKGTDWVTLEGKNIDKEYTVKIGKVDGAMTKITEFFEMIANFLFNTVPAFLAEAMKSDIWGRMLKILGQLGGALGG